MSTSTPTTSTSTKTTTNSVIVKTSQIKRMQQHRPPCEKTLSAVFKGLIKDLLQYINEYNFNYLNKVQTL
jgi:hypothetical protein